MPAPDASATVSNMQRAMQGLKTLRVDEQLGPAVVPVVSRYEMEAPDRMHVTVSNGFENFIIGATSYSRRSSAGAWQLQPLPPTHFPAFIWDSSLILDAHVVGSGTVDGVQTEIVTFFEQLSVSPLWFELWVSADGLVHRAQMTAEAHFMDHHFYDFDTPINIQAPTS